jgi:D-alanyl-D-alanine dipeptidase
VLNKLRNSCGNALICLLFLSTGSSFSSSAQSDSSITRPLVTRSWKEYAAQVKKEPLKKMVEIRSAIPDIVYDLRYASTNNFMHRLMYPDHTNHTFMRSAAVAALKNVQEVLKKSGMGLKIFDAYRPYAVTVKFWELVKDERYVANPSKGSGHNRGIAVDLTIIDLKTGKELDMGTGFDNFTDSAHHAFTQLPSAVLQNRYLLKSLMEKNGFKAFDTEWWHYFFGDPNKFEILDIDFKTLQKTIKL